MTGVELPGSGRSTFHFTFFSRPHSVGKSLSFESPDPARSPRQKGQSALKPLTQNTNQQESKNKRFISRYFDKSPPKCHNIQATIPRQDLQDRKDGEDFVLFIGFIQTKVVVYDLLQIPSSRPLLLLTSTKATNKPPTPLPLF